MKKLACGILASVSLLMPAGFAFGGTFDCEVTPLTRSGWMPQQLKFHFDRSFARAFVEDKLTGLSANAAVSRHSRMSVVLSWTVPRQPVSIVPHRVPQGTQPPQPFRALMNLDNLKLSVVVAPQGHGQTLIRGAGSCKRLQRDELAATADMAEGAI